MCFESTSTPGPMDAPSEEAGGIGGIPSVMSILQGATGGGGTGGAPRQGVASKAVNNPVTQEAATAAGTALAPATMGLSLLIPAATKLFGGMLAKKPPRNFGPPPVGNTDAGLDMLASRSFGGM